MAGEQLRFERRLRERLQEMEEKLDAQLKLETTGIYNALVRIEAYTKANQKTKGYDLEAFKKEMWREVSKDWSEALSASIAKTLVQDLTLILSDIKYETNGLDDNQF